MQVNPYVMSRDLISLFSKWHEIECSFMDSIKIPYKYWNDISSSLTGTKLRLGKRGHFKVTDIEILDIHIVRNVTVWTTIKLPCLDKDEFILNVDRALGGWMVPWKEKEFKDGFAIIESCIYILPPLQEPLGIATIL